MTRKHFQAIADALKESKPERYETSGDQYDLGAADQWRFTVRLVASACSQQNANFDRGRFFGACGYTP